MPPEPLFTVFTPTFNRAHTIRRVYDALVRQTCRDFEWLVVDDGSTDPTSGLVQDLAAAAAFPVRYLRQAHRGKHVAFNAGVAAARGRLFLPIDSDDSCVPHALERFREHWDRIPAQERDRFTGVTALGADPSGRVNGKRFPADVLDSDSRELVYRYGDRGDKWGFHRVEILRRYPFPELPGASFVPEGIVWSAIAAKFKTRFVNDVLLTIHASPSAGAQLSTARLSSGNAAALALWHRSTLNNDLRWFGAAPGRFLRTAAQYSRFSFDSRVGLRDQRRQLANAPAQLLWLVTVPLGAASSLWDRRRHSLDVPRGAARGRP